MNGFHLDAVGWILTVNARALNRQEALELSDLWTELRHARAEEFKGTALLYRLLFPRSPRLSEKTMEAFAELVDRMASLHPDRFGLDALRRRRDQWGLQAVVMALLFVLAVTFLPMAWPLAREVTLTLFVMGCACLIPTVTLWRAARAVKYFAANEHWKWQHSHGMSGHFLHR